MAGFRYFGLIAALFLAVPMATIAAESFSSQTLREGAGDPVTSTCRVKVHYTGWLTDSTKFDSSRDRGEPLQFTLGAGMVIAGWDKGIVGMKSGEIRRFVIPAELGYGERAVGPIPANSTLVFEVELISFEKGLEPDKFPTNLGSFTWSAAAPGVEVYDEKAGQGAVARPGMKLMAHFTGWLPGGTMVASSKSKGAPAELLLGANKLIKGWETGLAGVQAGAVRWLRLQPAAAYGASALPRIPPNSTLIYRIEVQSVEQEEASDGVDFFPDLSALKLQQGREGLQYAVVSPPTDSTAAPAESGQKVKVQYTGWLTDGSAFDSSRNRNTPFEFPLGAGRVIRGWDLGVEGMRPGEKRVLVVPPGIGYGSRGAGPIPPDATLVFLVEYIGTSAP